MLHPACTDAARNDGVLARAVHGDAARAGPDGGVTVARAAPSSGQSAGHCRALSSRPADASIRSTTATCAAVPGVARRGEHELLALERQAGAEHRGRLERLHGRAREDQRRRVAEGVQDAAVGIHEHRGAEVARLDLAGALEYGQLDRVGQADHRRAGSERRQGVVEDADRIQQLRVGDRQARQEPDDVAVGSGGQDQDALLGGEGGDGAGNVCARLMRVGIGELERRSSRRARGPRR